MNEQKEQKEQKEDSIRILRIIEYVGPRNWVETTINKSINGTHILAKDKRISVTTIGTFPEVMKKRNSE